MRGGSVYMCGQMEKHQEIHSLLAFTPLIYMCVYVCVYTENRVCVRARQCDHKSWPTSSCWLSWQCSQFQPAALCSLQLGAKGPSACAQWKSDFQSRKWAGEPVRDTASPLTFHPWIFTLLPQKCHKTWRRHQSRVSPEATCTLQSTGGNEMQRVSHE